MADGREGTAGVIAPPPLIYLGFLATGLLLKKLPPSRFLPSGVARLLGWPLLEGWFQRALRRANALWAILLLAVHGLVRRLDNETMLDILDSHLDRIIRYP